MIALPAHSVRIVLQVGMCAKCQSSLTPPLLFWDVILIRWMSRFHQVFIITCHMHLEIIFNFSCFRHLLIIQYHLWVIIKLLPGIIDDHEIYLILHRMHFFSNKPLYTAQVIYLLFVLAVGMFDAVDDFLLLKVVGLVQKEELPLHILVFK